jgi:hypothetical protein
MKRLLRWKIWYGDESTFSSADGDAVDAPADNVQVIAQRNSTVGREVWSGQDFYVYVGGIWVGMDDDGMKAYFRRIGLLKQTEALPTEKFRELYSQAIQDPELPKKSNTFPEEYKGNV